MKNIKYSNNKGLTVGISCTEFLRYDTQRFQAIGIRRHFRQGPGKRYSSVLYP